MGKVEYYTCDIYKCENKADENDIPVSVVWHTEQTEGRSIEPRLDLEQLDLCNTCIKKLVEGGTINVTGAQGHNKYRLR